MTNSDQNMKTHESTKKECIAVIEKHGLGFSYQQIGYALGISKATAWCIVKYWHDENRIDNKPRPGRQKQLSKRDERRLRLLNTGEPYATFCDNTSSSSVNVSDRVVGDYL